MPEEIERPEAEAPGIITGKSAGFGTFPCVVLRHHRTIGTSAPCGLFSAILRFKVCI